MALRSVLCWITGRPLIVTQEIEESYQCGRPTIFLKECFNATVTLTEPYKQNTPAVGSKPSGYRSVIRGFPGQTIKIYWWNNKKKWL